MAAVRSLVLPVLVVALGAGPVAAAVDAARVREAIARGADYLRKSRTGGGLGLGAPAGGMGDHTVGRAALAGMAMLEGGIPPDDPAVAAVAQAVRGGAAGESQTYDVALAILFLDRLGNPNDVPIIQLLGVRLYAGMSANGSWTYSSGSPPSPPGVPGMPPGGFPPAPPPQPEKPKPKRDDGFPTVTKKAKPAGDAEPEVGTLSEAAARYFLSVRQALRAGGRPATDGDNSNTQFGLIGLWVASKHGVPADDAFALIERRFLATQNRADAGWAYTAGSTSTAAMTCAGLLGLAVGGGRGQAAPPPRTDVPKGGADDPFFNPKKKEKAEPDGNGGLPGLTGAPAKKAAVASGLGALGAVLARARAGGGIDQGAGNSFYLLWSLERVGVVYGLTTIGSVDWYDWGANLLLAPGAQAQDGSWTSVGGGGGSGYGGEVDTAFAILFLAKSNFTRDLTSKLTGQVSDPGTSELRGGDIPLFTPATGKKAELRSGDPKNVARDPAPAPAPVTPDSVAEQVSQGLLTAGEQFVSRLELARDTKGADYTTGLVRAIPLLPAERQRQARDALADRLTRMTATSLRSMMRDPDAELRRGAVLAAAMKDDKAHVPDLIARLDDAADPVVRAARAGLKSLTGQDFGPATADAAAKAKAAADWKKWHAAQGK